MMYEKIPMMLSWIIVALFLLASGSFLWTGCNFQRSPAFERYLRSFDPGRIHIGTCVIIGVEQLPVLPEDVFDDAIRIKKEDYTYFVFLCAYYLSKLDMYYLQHFLQSYPPADRWNLDWGSDVPSCDRLTLSENRK